MEDVSQVAWTSSPFVAAVEPITESDEEIMRALEQAEIPPLLPALAYVTGDLSLLRDDLRPDPLLLAMPQGGLNEEQLAAARELAFDAIVRFRHGGSVPAPPPPHHVVLRLMGFAARPTGLAAVLPSLAGG